MAQSGITGWMQSGAAALLVAAALARPALAGGERPVLVELFTSQGCSSCPPADAFLSDLARTRPDVLALAFHVTYWNGLGWPDPYSLDAATERQRRYAALLAPHTVYTPQMIVDGVQDVIGSDRGEALATIRAAEATHPPGAAVSAARQGGVVAIALGAGAGEASVLLVGYDAEHRTRVGAGENGGRTLTESNIVRSIVVVGAWHGEALRLSADAPAGERLAVILQAADGRVVGIARVTAASTGA